MVVVCTWERTILIFSTGFSFKRYCSKENNDYIFIDCRPINFSILCACNKYSLLYCFAFKFVSILLSHENPCNPGKELMNFLYFYFFLKSSILIIIFTYISAQNKVCHISVQLFLTFLHYSHWNCYDWYFIYLLVTIFLAITSGSLR